MAVLKKTGERAIEFAFALIDEYRVRKPSDDAERHIWWQLLDSAPSIAANTAEGSGAQSDDDWISKFHIALKEGKETLLWLRLLAHTCPDRRERLRGLYKECDEIVAIIIASLKTKKRNMATKKALLHQQRATKRS